MYDCKSSLFIVTQLSCFRSCFKSHFRSFCQLFNTVDSRLNSSAYNQNLTLTTFFIHPPGMFFFISNGGEKKNDTKMIQVLLYTTSKQIELESLGCSGFEVF